MKKHVILIADLGNEFARELNEAIRSAGILVSPCEPGKQIESHDVQTAEHRETALVAAVCQVPPHYDSARLRALKDWAREQWPDIPIVACLNPAYRGLVKTRHQLKKIGVSAVAESPAQLPALLREVEENPVTENTLEPFKSLPDTSAFVLPRVSRTQTIRDAFALIAALHLSSNQKEAASIAVEGLARLVFADRWYVFFADQKSISNESEPELLAYKISLDQKTKASEDAQSTDSPTDSFPDSALPTKFAREALLKAEPVRKRIGNTWVAALPLVSGERIFGVIEGIRRRPENRSFTRSEVALLNALTMPIAAALSNSGRIAEAERLSLTDELTRLHNARYLRQFLVNEMKRARRFGSKITALFIDLDDFKHVNDLHGHLVGSHALMEIAGVILPSVRDTDCVVRYGGDEFVIILPDTGAHEAVQVAERIRMKIENHKFTGGRRLQIRLTASIGLAVFPDDAFSPHQLIACADTAMYAAKAANKNCVRVARSADSALNATRVTQESLDAAQFQRIPDQKFIS